jgi:hypothetical protein
MIRLEEVIQLKEGEEVRALARRHVVTLAPLLLTSLVLIVAPFFFLFPLFTSGPAGIIVFGVLVIVGIIIAVRGFVMWDGDLLIITNHRIIDVDQQGVFARAVNEISYLNMQDPAWSKKSPIDFMLGIGRVSARSNSGSLTVEATHVPRPKELHQLISDLSHQAASDAPAGSALFAKKEKDIPAEKSALIDRVSNQIADMDEEALKKLSDTLKGNQQDIAIAKVFGDDKNDLKEIQEP